MFTKHNLPCVSSVLHQRVNINYERSAGKESKSPLNVDPAKSSILILLQIYLLHCAFVARKKKYSSLLRQQLPGNFIPFEKQKHPSKTQGFDKETNFQGIQI